MASREWLSDKMLRICCTTFDLLYNLLYNKLQQIKVMEFELKPG